MFSQYRATHHLIELKVSVTGIQSTSNVVMDFHNVFKLNSSKLKLLSLFHLDDVNILLNIWNDLNCSFLQINVAIGTLSQVTLKSNTNLIFLAIRRFHDESSMLMNFVKLIFLHTPNVEELFVAELTIDIKRIATCPTCGLYITQS